MGETKRGGGAGVGRPYPEVLGPLREAAEAGEKGAAAAGYLRVARAERGAVAAWALAELARLHLEAGRHDEARARIAEALTHDASCPLALALEARERAAAGDAEGFFRLARRCLPGVEVGERERLMDLAADLLLERGAHRRFATLAQAALDGEARSAQLVAALAVAALRTKRVDRAEALAQLEPYLEDALPESVASVLRRLAADLLCALARSAARHREGGRALRLYDRALGIDPELGRARVGQGRLLLDLGHAEEALEVLLPAPAQEGGGEEAWALLGLCFLGLGKRSHALVCAERAGPFGRREPRLARLLKEA